LAQNTLILLPGLDGTGDLFADFVSELPKDLIVKVVGYPTNKFLSYAALVEYVAKSVPGEGPFIILAESFSTPLAVMLAAAFPSKVAGLILCAGFVTNPMRGWSPMAWALSWPWVIRLSPPRVLLEFFVTGPDAPVALMLALREALRRVEPGVLAGRIRTVLRCDVRQELRSVKVPILCVRPTHDRLLARASMEIQSLRPDAVVAWIPGPHLLLQREPRKSAKVVANFIRSEP
jgi:pimeloyl-[acyl-carrier protein] methyl ester esterase